MEQLEAIQKQLRHLEKQQEEILAHLTDESRKNPSLEPTKPEPPRTPMGSQPFAAEPIHIA
jgi:hypothetical protein